MDPNGATLRTLIALRERDLEDAQQRCARAAQELDRLEADLRSRCDQLSNHRKVLSDFEQTFHSQPPTTAHALQNRAHYAKRLRHGLDRLDDRVRVAQEALERGRETFAHAQRQVAQCRAQRKALINRQQSLAAKAATKRELRQEPE